MSRSAWSWLAVAMACAGAHAACNDPSDWMKSPSNGVKWAVVPANDISAYVMYMPMDGLTVDASPYPLTKEFAARVGMGPLVASNPQQGSLDAHILYYEPDGKGAWRVCRDEDWEKLNPAAPGFNPQAYLSRPQPSQVRYMAAAKANPLIATLTAGWWPNAADVLLYNDKGQLAETFTASFGEKAIDRTHLNCARYDEKGRLTLYVAPAQDRECPTGAPARDDFYHEFRFGIVDGKEMTVRSNYHQNYPGYTSWSEEVEAFPLGYWATQGSEHGLTMLQMNDDLAPLDMSARNASPNQIRYYFPRDRVFLSDIESDFSRIYQHDRRREAHNPVDGRVLAEYFKANAHIPLYRFQLIGGRTERQEQLDAQGHTTRIIDVGREKTPWLPDEAFTPPPKLNGHEIYYRVWDVAANGKKTLVALGWNRAKRPWFGHGQDTDTLDSAYVLYGLPDGTPQWNEDQFAARFGFDANASVLYGKREQDE